MKDIYISSLCHKGILGGAIYLEKDKAVFRTNKLTVEEQYRNLQIPYDNIDAIQMGWLMFFPTVVVKLKAGVSYKFIVFSRRRFLNRIGELRRG